MALALLKARSHGLQLIGQDRWPSRLTQRLNLTGRTLSVRFYPNSVGSSYRELRYGKPAHRASRRTFPLSNSST